MQLILTPKLQFRQHPLTASSPHGGSINAVTYGPQGNIADSLGSNVVTGSSPASTAASRHQHPLPAHVFRYWSLFLANVHPLTKIIHVPHVQQIISMSGSDSLSISDKNTTDALRYSIYACAVASLDADECHRHFGASQASLLDEWQSAARDALFGSSFLRVPDLDLLRALVLLLVSACDCSPQHFGAFPNLFFLVDVHATDNRDRVVVDSDGLCASHGRVTRSTSGRRRSRIITL